MRHCEFRIGQAFRCAGKRWRCTDVGTRVIVAICLESHEVVTREVGKDAPGAVREHRRMTHEPSWFTGPPYAVVEEVFDENSMGACSPDPEKG